jgi:CRISPR-associated protein Cas2
MIRKLYLACYDITCPKRLRLCLKVLKGYASGRQYSCFECYLSRRERDELLATMRELTESDDAFALLCLQRQRTIHPLGQGVAPQDEAFMWVG